MLDSEFLPAVIKNIPLFVTIFGATLSLLLINCFSVSQNYVFDSKMTPQYRFIYTLLNKK